MDINVYILDTAGFMLVPVCGLLEPVSVNKSFCKIVVLRMSSSV